MTPLYGETNLVACFVAQNIEGCERGFGNCQAIGFLDGQGRLVAGMVYHNWNPEAEVIEMSGASLTPRWLTRPVLHLMFGYPFHDLHCQLVVMRVAETDKRLHRQLYACGFKSHKIPRLRGRDKAEIIFTLTDDDWFSSKFMRASYGQAIASQAA